MKKNTLYSKEVSGVMLFKENGALLMQHRDEKPNLPYAGMWSIPSGLKKPSESPEDCARRELFEETSYQCDALKLLLAMSDRDDTATDYQLTIFWAYYDGRQALKCLEGQAIKFVERSEAAAYSMPPFILDVWDRAIKEIKSSKTVPYVDLGYQVKEIKLELLSAFEKVLDSGQYILGPSLTSFEKEFAAYCGTRYAVGVSNGTSALLLTLKALGIGPGDEVVTAPNSFIASASSIALAGGIPVFADVGADMNIDPKSVERAVTSRTRAILPVHLTGRPARMPEILEIAKRHNLFVIEDAAQAVGAKLGARRVGGWGKAACFSLHPLKNLHAFGDGGMITTDDETLYRQLAQARNHGLRNRQDCDFWSSNSRLDEIQAAMLSVQLKRLDSWTEERRRLAFRYHELLEKFVEVPKEGPGEFCVYQTYMIQADRRDALKEFLNENGVQAAIHYPTPIPLQHAASKLGYSAKDFPRVMKIVSRILSLPLYPGMTQTQQERVEKFIRGFYEK